MIYEAVALCPLLILTPCDACALNCHNGARDIKPQNVLLETPPARGGRPVARLTDFGSACIYDEDRARAENGNGFSVRYCGWLTE